MNLSDAFAGGVRIRAVRRDDRERILAAFEALDPASVYLRFFAPKKGLSARELQWVTEPDEDRQVVLVATTRCEGKESVVGLGQYIRDGDLAHVAFVVADHYQGRGIASRMLRVLARIARSRGIRTFEADVLAENGAMLSVFRRSHLRACEREEDGVVHVTLSLDDRRGATHTLWPRLSTRPPFRHLF